MDIQLNKGDRVFGLDGTGTPKGVEFRRNGMITIMKEHTTTYRELHNTVKESVMVDHRELGIIEVVKGGDN